MTVRRDSVKNANAPVRGPGVTDERARPGLDRPAPAFETVDPAKDVANR